MTDEVTVEDAGGAGGAIVPTDPAAGASGQPLQVWLARVVGTTDPISPDDLFDGDLLARALIELERRTDGTATGGPGDATADEVFGHEDLGAALDRAGLLKECAGALDALMRGFNDWNGRDQDAPLRILAAVYAHYLRNRDRVYDGGEIPGDGGRDDGDADPGPGDHPSPSLLSPTKPVRERSSSSSSATRLSQSLTAIHPATESPIKPQTPSGGFKASPAEVKAAQAARERAKAAAAAAAAEATGQLLGETASLRASLASLRASLTPSETDALVSGDALDVARASMAESFVPPLPSDDDENEEEEEGEEAEGDMGKEEETTRTNPGEAGVLDALMAEARVDHLADETAASEQQAAPSEEGPVDEGTRSSRRALEVRLPSAASFDRSLSSSPVATPTTSPARPTRPSRFSHADDKDEEEDDDEEEEEVEEEDDGVWRPSPSAAEEAQRDLIERLAGLPLEDDDDALAASVISASAASAPGVSSSVDASTDLSRIGRWRDDDDDGRLDWSDDFRLPSPPGLTADGGRGDPAARMAMDARKRQIEAVRAEEARAYGERRRAAGKEALMRFFASKKAEGGDPGPTVKTSTGVRKPLRLKSPNGAASVRPASPSPPAPAAATRGDATLPRVATLRPGRGRWSRDPTEPPSVKDPTDADADRPVPTDVSADARDPRAGQTPHSPTTARGKPRPNSNPVAANLPRVATHDPEVHARSVRAAAAFFAAEESVARVAMSAAATRSRMDIERDEAVGMPDRRPAAPPLPKVAAFSPGQVRHERRRREPADDDADDDEYVDLAGWAPRGAGAGEDVDLRDSMTGRVGDAPPDAFPAWFGVVHREGGRRGVEEPEPAEEEADPVDKEWGVPGLATGSSGIVVPGLSSPAVIRPLPASPSPKTSPPVAKRSQTKKGEAMWVDLAAWADAKHAGIPSGAWGVGDGQMKKMAPKIGAAEVKKRSVAAAAEARERKMGALVAAGITGTRGKDKDTARDRTGDPRTDPRLFKAAPPLSNKKLVRNALRHVCLAGAAMRTQLDEALAALDAVAPDVATVFVILFRENTSPHKYRALYALVSGDGGVDDADGVLVKIHGTGGPARVGLQWVDATMKYDSGQREFKPLETSGRLTPLTAAVTLVSKK